MAIMHSTRFSPSRAVQVPLALASAMVGNSQLLYVTGMVNVVARWATFVCTASLLLICCLRMSILWIRLTTNRNFRMDLIGGSNLRQITALPAKQKVAIGKNGKATRKGIGRRM